MTTKRFNSTLLVLVALAALPPLVHPELASYTARDVGPLSITRVNNLEVTGTTLATGVVTTQAGVRLTTLTTGPLVTSGAGSPNGVLAATIGSLYLRTGTAQVWQNTNGATTWAQLGAGSGATPSVVIVDDPGFANTNVSTLGTIDWFIPTNSSIVQPWTLGTTALHAKKIGGQIAQTFRYHGIGAGVAFASMTVSCNAGDDYAGNAAFSTSSISGIQNTGSLGMGYTVSVPAVGTQRVLRMYISAAGNNPSAVTITATLQGAGTTDTEVWAIGAGDASTMTITYNGAAQDILVVTALFTQGSGVLTMLIPALTLGPV